MPKATVREKFRAILKAEMAEVERFNMRMARFEKQRHNLQKRCPHSWTSLTREIEYCTICGLQKGVR
jgi:hypothetical protein